MMISNFNELGLMQNILQSKRTEIAENIHKAGTLDQTMNIEQVFQYLLLSLKAVKNKERRGKVYCLK